MRIAHAQFVDPERYARIEHSTVAVRRLPAAGPVEVDGCALRWRTSTLDETLTGSVSVRPQPGPLPGWLTVAPAYGGGWRIIDCHLC